MLTIAFTCFNPSDMGLQVVTVSKAMVPAVDDLAFSIAVLHSIAKY